jgi:ATP-dependent helicase/nuclease subunit A
MTRAQALPHLPPDQDQRDLILRELDRTVLVEAAAGTGKTTCMVGRMVGLLASGHCGIGTLAAVTFTRKAAAELRARFQSELERSVESASGVERENLAKALAHVEQCFIGTIHSFSARLLRERPVEAGVDFNFKEMDEDTDQALRKQAWEEAVAALYAEEAPLLADIERFGLRLGDLGEAFLRFADYPDVEEWPIPDDTLPDLRPATSALRDFVRHMREMAPTLPKDPGNDALIPKYQRIPRRVRLADLNRPADLFSLLEEFKPFAEKQGVIQKMWPGKKEQALAEKALWNEFAEKTAAPLVTSWRECRYGVVLRAFAAAREVYDHLRASSGWLNYQDLLLLSARLLRDKPNIRRYFKKRFSHLLVDEFQDTDPVQAEVMLLLSADNPEEQDWRKCRPDPGSLFVVGDPKQSIYRFRRADIVTYNQVKHIISESGGLVATLSANFRTIAPLIEWINHAFKQEFPDSATAYSPVYVPLAAGRSEGPARGVPTVRLLQIAQGLGKAEEVVRHEAGVIARAIEAAIEEGLEIPRSPKELDNGASPRANPGDFLIIARQTRHLALYADALRRLGLPHEVTGGTALNETLEVALLHTCLAAVLRPDDPVALVAALRSELFGFSDADLFAYKRADGEFRFGTGIPQGLKEDTADRFESAYARLRRYSRWLDALPVVPAIERIVDDLGLMALAVSRLGGSEQAGGLAKAIELLRSSESEAWTPETALESLARLISAEVKRDALPIRPNTSPAVRVMNLHKVKGLEAPVVFLADPTGVSDHRTHLHVDRSGQAVRGYMAVHGKGNSWGQGPLLAHSAGWERCEQEEAKFLDQEELRLLYVAATRAGSQLIITQRPTNKGKNPWTFFEPHLVDCPAIEEPPGEEEEEVEEFTLSMEEIEEGIESVRRRGEVIRQPTYHLDSAKRISLQPRRTVSPGGEHGTEWGTVLHALLQLAMTNPEADLLSAAIDQLRENDLETHLAEEAVATVRSVMGSEIWRRALSSPKRFVEVPFQLEDRRPLPSANHVPRYLRGQIDLVFWETQGWVIVDYKSDSAKETELPGLVEHYRDQIETYAWTWTQATGEPVAEKGLFFTHSQGYWKIET